MTDTNETTPVSEPNPAEAATPADASVVAPTPQTAASAAVAGYPAAPYTVPDQAGRAPIGRIRGTGACIALAIITLGFYTVHSEMKRHSGQGLGGGLALVLTIFLGFVMPFITSSETGKLYERANLRKPVSGATGLWYLLGWLILIGPLVWFVKTNAAINNYWRMHGAA